MKRITILMVAMLMAAVSALAAAMMYGCASQPADDTAGKSETMMDKAKAAVGKVVEKVAPKKEEPKLMSGASAAMLADTCAGCHGTGGSSTGPATPTIAGLEEEYFNEVMADYKSGARASTIMGRIAKGYTEEEIAAMASFYSSKAFPGRTQTSAGPLAQAGKKLHDEYCEKCHEDEGRSVDDIVLAGQWMKYTHWTLEDFASGASTINEEKMAKKMKEMLDAHGPESLEQLTHFYGSRQ